MFPQDATDSRRPPGAAAPTLDVATARAGPSDAVRAALLVIGAGFMFAAVNAVVRQVMVELHPFEVALFRWVFGAMFLVPWALRHAGLKTARLELHLGRALLTLASTLMWFVALVKLPMAQAVALNFTVPLFVTLGAALFLGETVRRRRWTAIAVGFVGVLVIVRPGAVDLSWPMALPVLAAVTMATSVLVMKTLTRTDATSTIVAYQSLLVIPLTAIAAAFFFQLPTWPALGLMVAIGFMASVAHLLLTRAFALAEASAVITFDYVRLPFVALIAFVAFGETPDAWTWVGAAIIAASAIYIARREAQLAKAGRETVGAKAPHVAGPPH